MSAKHTPTPWSATMAPCGYIYAICNDANNWIRVETSNPADAEFIVCAANAHDDIVAALLAARSILPVGRELGLVESALEKAGIK